jgi:hypothetical protein
VPPRAHYASLTQPMHAPPPDAHSIFRGIKATLSRRTMEDNGRGQRKLLICHQAVTRFLWLQVTFSTQLLIDEDDKAVRRRAGGGWRGGWMDAVNGGDWSKKALQRVSQTGRRANASAADADPLPPLRTTAAHHLLPKRARRRLHENLHRQVGGVAVLPGAAPAAGRWRQRCSLS